MKKTVYNILVKKLEDNVVISKILHEIVSNNEEQAIELATKSYKEGNQDFQIESIEISELNFDKKAVDEYGVDYIVADNTKEVYDFNNTVKKIKYSASALLMKDIDRQDAFYKTSCIYEVDGIVDDIEEKLNSWNNPIKFIYASLVGFNSSKNDPDSRIWETCIEYAKNHQDDFFTKTGDWKKRVEAAKNKMMLALVDNE